MFFNTFFGVDFAAYGLNLAMLKTHRLVLREKLNYTATPTTLLGNRSLGISARVQF